MPCKLLLKLKYFFLSFRVVLAEVSPVNVHLVPEDATFGQELGVLRLLWLLFEKRRRELKSLLALLWALTSEAELLLHIDAEIRRYGIGALNSELVTATLGTLLLLFALLLFFLYTLLFSFTTLSFVIEELLLKRVVVLGPVDRL